LVKKYSIILADPSWQYNNKNTGGSMISGSNAKYNTMSQNDIESLNISKIARKDSFLFLWVTYPMLQEGLNVMKKWGFEYKTVAFTWVKKTKNNKDHFGMGFWTRANPEICLLGVKGKPKVKSHSVRQLTYAQVEEHSKKPDIIREKIIQLCGNLSKIELFARQENDKWDTIGLELGKDLRNL
jgi:N6-adenosine-specific RNA methylase IME4